MEQGIQIRLNVVSAAPGFGTICVKFAWKHRNLGLHAGQAIWFRRPIIHEIWTSRHCSNTPVQRVPTTIEPSFLNELGELEGLAYCPAAIVKKICQASWLGSSLYLILPYMLDEPVRSLVLRITDTENVRVEQKFRIHFFRKFKYINIYIYIYI